MGGSPYFITDVSTSEERKKENEVEPAHTMISHAYLLFGHVTGAFTCNRKDTGSPKTSLILVKDLSVYSIQIKLVSREPTCTVCSH